jgi:hypothetical protein
MRHHYVALDREQHREDGYASLYRAVIEQAICDLERDIPAITNKGYAAQATWRQRDAQDFLTNPTRLEPVCEVAQLPADRIIAKYRRSA